MNLGATDKVKPLIEAVRQMIEEEIVPLENEYFNEVGYVEHQATKRFKPQ